MHKLKQFTFALVAVCALSTACGQSGTAETTSASAAETKAETTVETTAAVESKAAVASGNETAAEQTIDTVGLVPVSAADLKDGTYDISVESSSSMFKIISCALTVKEGRDDRENDHGRNRISLCLHGNRRGGIEGTGSRP